jgi:putative Mg2+ transporter-C (MgtC) family protein
MNFFDQLLSTQDVSMAIHLAAALVAGGIIGLERSYHGRPAGFRTHTLVCLASSSLMMVTLFQSTWMTGASVGDVHIDPTRMAQGIMTGIGFLGAGVIYKEGITVRGLTTAASIWMTAAIGILMGIGLFFPGTMATMLTLGILSSFHIIERNMTKRAYIHCSITFERAKLMREKDLSALLKSLGFSVGNLSYRCTDNGRKFEYHMVVRTMDIEGASKLTEALATHPEICEFHIAPSGD